MNTEKVTIEQAAELVKNSVGDVFSRDAVLGLLDRLIIPEKASEEVATNIAPLIKFLESREELVKTEIGDAIENYWDEMYNIDELECTTSGNTIEVTSVGIAGYNQTNYVYKHAAQNVISSIVGALEDEYEIFLTNTKTENND